MGQDPIINSSTACRANPLGLILRRSPRLFSPNSTREKKTFCRQCIRRSEM